MKKNEPVRIVLFVRVQSVTQALSVDENCPSEAKKEVLLVRPILGSLVATTQDDPFFGAVVQTDTQDLGMVVAGMGQVPVVPSYEKAASTGELPEGALTGRWRPPPGRF